MAPVIVAFAPRWRVGLNEELRELGNDLSPDPGRDLRNRAFALGRELIAVHRRGLALRIISDGEKRFDVGSDIQQPIDAGVPLRIDNSPFHMHHKFALFDDRLLLNGRFNWTRSASTSNEENLLVTDDPHLVAEYRREFETLWGRYRPS